VPTRGSDWKANLWRLPARHVAPYAVPDATSTFGLWEAQRQLMEQQDAEARAQAEERGTWGQLGPMERQGVMDAYRLEMDLVPCVHEMRWRGVRVDVERAAREAEALRAQRDEALHELSRRLGERVGMEDVGRTRWLERVFTDAGIRFPRTAPTRGHP
jgi:hypothetical protein